MAQIKKHDWLLEGFRVLEEIGAAGLKIDHLTQRLGVTKGSFYHHFTNIQDYKESLLQYYEDAGTLKIIEAAEQETRPQAKLERILDATLEGPFAGEIAVRAWALQDEQAAGYQERVDQRRMNYLKDIYLEITGDETQARIQAQTLYAIYIGSLQFFPPLSQDELYALYENFKSQLGV